MSDLTQAKDVYDEMENIQLVDVRESYEWEAGRIEGAALVPLNDLMGGAGDFDADRPVVAVCRTGNRSELATMMLRARGLDAHNLEGGMEAWEAAGLPFSAPDGSPGKVV